MSSSVLPRLVAPPGSRSFDFSRLAPPDLLRFEKQLPSSLLLAPVVASQDAEERLLEVALALSRQSGADYADLRLGTDYYRELSVHDTSVSGHALQKSSGVGIRILMKGFWGFAATSDLSEEGVKRCVMRAVSQAKGVAAVTPERFAFQMNKWAAEPAHIATHHTPVAVCPLSTNVEELSKLFRETAERALPQTGVKRVTAVMNVHAWRRWFASSEGAKILSTHCVVDAQQQVVAVANGTSSYRTLVSPSMAGGLEHFLCAQFPEKAISAAADALAKCNAETAPTGEYNLIIDGHNLALTMHESVGHPTELDRVLGHEMSLAGASFATLEKRGVFRYGSPLVNFTADNRIRFGGASVGYDDEGVECQRFPIIEEGILVGYGTNRECAHEINQERANGTTRSMTWADAPIVRIPNLYLEPGKTPLSLKELIADTKDGILMLGRDSFSIDQMRYNFQFGSDMAYRIRKGEICEPLRDVIYQSITPEFWSACDAICDASEWEMHGVFNCGKGHPMQTAQMMHGASPARFRNIRVGF
jgi:TldD protein